MPAVTQMVIEWRIRLSLRMSLLVASLRHPDGFRECLFIGERRNRPADSQNGANDPERPKRRLFLRSFVERQTRRRSSGQSRGESIIPTRTPSTSTPHRLATTPSGARPPVYFGTCTNGCIEDDRASPHRIAHGAGTESGVVGWAFWSMACGATNGTTPRLRADASSGSRLRYLTGSWKTAGFPQRAAVTVSTSPGLARGRIGLSSIAS
jgi:hypothetical protein